MLVQSVSFSFVYLIFYSYILHYIVTLQEEPKEESDDDMGFSLFD